MLLRVFELEYEMAKIVCRNLPAKLMKGQTIF